MKAPVTAIIGYDLKFHHHTPKLFPNNPAMREHFANNQKLAEVTAFRNGSLQGAYLIIAARALGLDCGPMSGFDKDAVDAAFFQGTPWKSDVLINLGYGDATKLFGRLPRLDVVEACRFA